MVSAIEQALKISCWNKDRRQQHRISGSDAMNIKETISENNSSSIRFWKKKIFLLD